jgi:hypothetical protein
LIQDSKEDLEMNSAVRGRGTAAFVIFVLIAVARHASAAGTDSGPFVSGDAFGAFVSVPPASDVGPTPVVELPPSGGSEQAQASSLSVPTLLSSSTLAVSTSGTVTATGASSQSTASVQNLNLLGGMITADVVTASSQ